MRGTDRALRFRTPARQRAHEEVRLDVGEVSTTSGNLSAQADSVIGSACFGLTRWIMKGELERARPITGVR